jgi:predicted  nucleic acid-binding Zn-ribbon protein
MNTKLIALALAAGLALPAAAQAGTTRAELRKDVRDVHQERHDLARAYHSGNPARIKAEKRELRGAKQELREDARDLHRARRP